MKKIVCMLLLGLSILYSANAGEGVSIGYVGYVHAVVSEVKHNGVIATIFLDRIFIECNTKDMYDGKEIILFVRQNGYWKDLLRTEKILRFEVDEKAEKKFIAEMARKREEADIESWKRYRKEQEIKKEEKEIAENWPSTDEVIASDDALHLNGKAYKDGDFLTIKSQENGMYYSWKVKKIGKGEFSIKRYRYSSYPEYFDP